MGSSLSRLIISPLTFLAVVVPDIVLVLFVELVVRHAGSVHTSPEYDRFVEWETQTLYISSVLELAPVGRRCAHLKNVDFYSPSYDPIDGCAFFPSLSRH